MRLELRPDFQRKTVWSPAAKIMLVDTILKNIPMPKIFLQAVIRDEKTYRIVIDGQQRLTAILSYLRGEFKLEKPYKGEFLNLKFDELPDDAKTDFLGYLVDMNEIYNASDDVVREIYSRVNKYTIALNKQELRRADFPGDFLDLSEKLTTLKFFEESRIFTIANSKRMGDVEYISELLALIIIGPQDKKETLDQFYMDYSIWNHEHMQHIRNEFQLIIDDILMIFPLDSYPIAKTRFRQKADFYSLFAAIHELHKDGYSLEGKKVETLREDFVILDRNISPEDDVKVFSEYAVKCVSQGNTIGSRLWRREFLRRFLLGTYSGKPPDKEIIDFFKNIICSSCAADFMCPQACQECPICQREIKDCRKEEIVLTWPKSSSAFQLSNAGMAHLKCIKECFADYYFIKDTNNIGSEQPLFDNNQEEAK